MKRIQAIQPDKLEVSIALVKVLQPPASGSNASVRNYVLARDDRVRRFKSVDPKFQAIYQTVTNALGKAQQLRVLLHERTPTMPLHLYTLEGGAFSVYHLWNSKSNQQAWFEVYDAKTSFPQEFRYRIRYAESKASSVEQVDLSELLQQQSNYQIGWASVASIDSLVEWARTVQSPKIWPQKDLKVVDSNAPFVATTEGVRLILYRSKGRQLKAVDDVSTIRTNDKPNTMYLGLDRTFDLALSDEDKKNPNIPLGWDNLSKKTALVRLSKGLINALENFARGSNKFERQQAIQILATIAEGAPDSMSESEVRNLLPVPSTPGRITPEGLELIAFYLRVQALEILEKIVESTGNSQKLRWVRVRETIKHRVEAIAKNPSSPSQTLALELWKKLNGVMSSAVSQNTKSLN